MPRTLITLDLILQSIDGWREQVQEIAQEADAERQLRLILHLDLAMEQAQQALRHLIRPGDPLA